MLHANETGVSSSHLGLLLVCAFTFYINGIKKENQAPVQILDSTIQRISDNRKLITLPTGQRFIQWIALSTFWTTGARSKILLMQKIVLDKVVNFKDFSRPNKDLKQFSRTLNEFKDFSRLYETCHFSRASQPFCLSCKRLAQGSLARGDPSTVVSWYLTL